MSKWNFVILNNWEEIWSKENLSRWEELMEQSPYVHVFFHPALVKAWVETYRPLRKLTPIFLWMLDDNGNRGIFPLVLWRKNWKNAFTRSIVPIGYSDFDYHDPIFLQRVEDISSFWNQFFEFLRQHYRYDEICIDGITEKMLPPKA